MTLAKQAAGRTRIRVRTATASASKKVILNVECSRSECRELSGASDGTRLGAIFGNADFSLHQGEIGGGEVYDADSRAGGYDPASSGRQGRSRDSADRNWQDAGVPDSGNRKIAQG